MELIAAGWEVRIQVTAVICQRVLDVLGMPVECTLSILVSVFMVKGDIRNFSYYRAVKLLQFGVKAVGRVFEKSFAE